MKCTYLYNHAIYFNETLHKLGVSQSFQIVQVKLMTFVPLQGHVIQYGCQTLFLGTKISV